MIPTLTQLSSQVKITKKANANKIGSEKQRQLEKKQQAILQVKKDGTGKKLGMLAILQMQNV